VRKSAQAGIATFSVRLISDLCAPCENFRDHGRDGNASHSLKLLTGDSHPPFASATEEFENHKGTKDPARPGAATDGEEPRRVQKTEGRKPLMNANTREYGGMDVARNTEGRRRAVLVARSVSEGER
jgi:hypothetical protein